MADFTTPPHTQAAAPEHALPYAGIRVVEFTHMVMGPTCGMVLADLGAEVIKVEPIGHGRQCHAPAAGLGRRLFPHVQPQQEKPGAGPANARGQGGGAAPDRHGRHRQRELQARHHEKLGLDYASLKTLNPRLIYVSHKGFLPGPYDHRTALDEVVQMMGGLAYMTGRPGDPLRAGTSVNDIMGGMFGAIGAMAALAQRAQTGQGQEVQSALFENNVFLVAQHMMQFAVTGKPAAPMPARISAWAIYDVFK
jgi:crotonobetainyl-CoA:carnitine CoA-transferase CaiB-like acyl-CoA transferase